MKVHSPFDIQNVKLEKNLTRPIFFYIPTYTIRPKQGQRTHYWQNIKQYSGHTQLHNIKTCFFFFFYLRISLYFGPALFFTIPFKLFRLFCFSLNTLYVYPLFCMFSTLALFHPTAATENKFSESGSSGVLARNFWLKLQ